MNVSSRCPTEPTGRSPDNFLICIEDAFFATANGQHRFMFVVRLLLSYCPFEPYARLGYFANHIDVIAPIFGL